VITLYTKKEMIQAASYCIGENIDEDSEGFIDPSLADWFLVESYNYKYLISLMGNIESWKEWLEDEIESLKDIRGQEYFDDLKNNPIREPIIITIIGNTPYIWDGWHRLASAIVMGKNLPVIVGITGDLNLNYPFWE
jgi:hypothetical protein